ncbi:cAMP-dependent protein kinase catalytic subunit [Orchesella cincta]|uniref:cAMP-dependent protein kinase n=1 Tax=Orchesella cincta TaxID=48709 RepID=A0A1D2N413_ORCCI|nr:cAMP-dependent protein kinase catalytic subunit [Orchesella cincta]
MIDISMKLIISHDAPISILQPTGKLDDYIICKKLGSGQFGKVYLVQDFMDRKHYALKMISKDVILRNHLKKDVESERDYLYSTNSPFIVSLIHHFEDAKAVFFVEEYLSNGDIYEHLKQNGPFSEELTKFYSSQVVLALEYLHNVNLIYRDLKPENVMIDSHGFIKLVDFGFVKRVKREDNYKTSTMVGTPSYMAPELILHKSYDKNIDWWALGILVYEMLAGIQNTPFADANRMVMYEKITSKEVTFSNKFPHTTVRDLIKRLLKVNPTLRLGSGPNGSKDVKNHPWWVSLKWNDIYRRNIAPPTKSKNLFNKANNYRGPKNTKLSGMGVTSSRPVDINLLRLENKIRMELNF